MTTTKNTTFHNLSDAASRTYIATVGTKSYEYAVSLGDDSYDAWQATDHIMPNGRVMGRCGYQLENGYIIFAATKNIAKAIARDLITKRIEPRDAD